MTAELGKNNGNINGKVYIKGEKLKGLYPQPNSYRQLMTAGKNRFTFFQE